MVRELMSSTRGLLKARKVDTIEYKGRLIAILFVLDDGVWLVLSLVTFKALTRGEYL